MALSKEQIAEIKKQILEQTTHLPEEQRSKIIEQVNNMTPEQLEDFVKQQMSSSPNSNSQQEIYRAIVSGEIPSRQIDENSKALAVLEIKPISKGHIIIIPKNPAPKSKDIPAQAFTLAKKISKKIISKLKAEGTEIQTSFAFGEIIINVIPVYDKPVSINSPRYDAEEKEMEELYKILHVKKRNPVIRKPRKKKSKSEKVIKVKRRIP